jgi:hypothetical protein
MAPESKAPLENSVRLKPSGQSSVEQAVAAGPDTMARAQPVSYNPSFEFVAEDERQTEQGLIETLTKIQTRVYEDSGEAFRGVHAKCHGIIVGELRVIDSPAPQYAQGMFAAAGRYPVVIRLSSIPGDVLDDEVSVPRGLALKVIGVPGERVTGSEEDVTQDFVLANGPSFAKPEPKAFLSTLKLLAATTDRVPKLKKILSAVMRGSEKLLESVGLQSATALTLGGYPETNILGDEFYSQAPILYGQYMAKVRLVPGSAELRALSNAKLDLSGKPNGIRDAVISHFQNQSACWELQVQLCTDLHKMPIEDASSPWPEELSPYVTVAVVEAPPQDVWSDSRRGADAELAFSPWHALAAHRPLGGVMRVRRRA